METREIAKMETSLASLPVIVISFAGLNFIFLKKHRKRKKSALEKLSRRKLAFENATTLSKNAKTKKY